MTVQPLTYMTSAAVGLAHERPLVHRSVLATREPSAFEKARAATLAWVAAKHGEVPRASGRHQLAEHVVFSSDTTYTADGREQAMRFQLREDNREATWRTTVLAARAGAVTQLCVSLEVFPNTDNPPWPARPGLIRTLVTALGPADGSATLASVAEEIDEARVSRLIDILCDSDRLKPAIVAATPAYPDPLWSERMGKIAYQAAGAASFYVLTSTGAVRAFRDEIGEEHRVATASVRTFLPGVDPAWAPDARRHRFITARAFGDPETEAWRFVPIDLYRIDTAAPLPDALRTVVFPEIAEDRREQRQAAIRVARQDESAEALRAEVTDLKELLDAADDELETLGDNYALAQRTIAALEQQYGDVLAQAEQDAEEALVAMDEAERARQEAAILRSRLYAQNRYEDVAIAAAEAQGLPLSFEELFERASAELEGLTVTALRSVTVGLDVHERSATWAAKAWRGLRTLSEYALDNEDFAGGFYDYCRSGRSKYGWPVKEVAMCESDTTMRNWGGERIFPVPEGFDPSGSATMQAHLQIERKGSVCPRIYFLDDTKGETGQVIVGYIGPHLTNTKTN